MSYTLSRRDFLKTAAASAVGVASMGVLNTFAAADDTAEVEAQVIVPDAVEECDVVVVGVGCAGISACVEAAAEGMKVVGIDRALSVAGTNACSVVGIYGIKDASELGPQFTYLTSSSHYQFNNRFIRRYLDIIETQMERYEANGVTMRKTETPSADGSFTGVQHMYSARANDRAIEFEAMFANYPNLELHWQTQVLDLVIEDGKVTGAYAKDVDGKITQYNAKGGVIVCTGGFANNPDMIRQYMGGAISIPTGSSFNDGCGIKMLQGAGAQLGKNFAINATEGGALQPKATCPKNVMMPTYNAMLRGILMGDVIINKHGERFVDEAVMCKKTMMFCSEPVTREGGRYFTIMTQKEMDMLKEMTLADFCIERYGFEITHGMIKKFLASSPMPNFQEDADAAISEGWCWKGNTFEELEQASGIPNIVKTMTEYNEMCASGEDTLLYKDPAFLKPYVEEDGPFYLIENFLGSCCTQGGVKTDGDCRALNSEGDVIEGLFVAGMDADLESVPYLVGATCHGFSVGSGYIAAEAASKRAKA